MGLPERGHRHDLNASNDGTNPVLPPQSGAGSLQRFVPGAPTFSGNGMPLTPGKLRDGWWAQFKQDHGAICDNVCRKAGERFIWSAWVHSESDARPQITVLGSKGLCFARPTLNEKGDPRAWAINTYHFDPASHIVVCLDHNPADGGSPNVSESAERSPTSTAEIGGLADAAKAQIGNLPVTAQRFLLTPYLRSAAIKDWDYYYEGYPDHIDTYVLILAGAATITAVTGNNRVVANQHRSSRAWTLEGHRYTVVPSRPGIRGTATRRAIGRST